jgi:hypothetical protein
LEQFCEHAARDCHLGHLERDVAPVADYLGSDLESPMLHTSSAGPRVTTPLLEGWPVCEEYDALRSSLVADPGCHLIAIYIRSTGRERDLRTALQPLVQPRRFPLSKNRITTRLFQWDDRGSKTVTISFGRFSVVAEVHCTDEVRRCGLGGAVADG